VRGDWRCFLGSRDRHVSGLRPSSDGCGMVVVPRDAQVAQVCQLRFVGPIAGGDPDEEGTGVMGQGRETKVKAKAKARGVVTHRHVYDLRRRTSAGGESISCLHSDMILIGLVFCSISLC
jgi:hypothetical protein